MARLSDADIKSICCRKRAKASEWDSVEATPAVNRWDNTPGPVDADATPGRWDQTPGVGGSSKWAQTPTPGRDPSEPTPRKNRWDETPTPRQVSVTSAISEVLFSHIWFSFSVVSLLASCELANEEYRGHGGNKLRHMKVVARLHS